MESGWNLVRIRLSLRGFGRSNPVKASAGTKIGSCVAGEACWITTVLERLVMAPVGFTTGLTKIVTL